jgi:hypothetical protein
MDASTEVKIKDVVERELVAVHMRTLIEVCAHGGLVVKKIFFLDERFWMRFHAAG